MRIAILNTDYARFLSWLYGHEPGLAEASYAHQMRARNASLFGVADFYSRGFKALGHEAIEIHLNNGYLQAAWAREHGLAQLADELGVAPARARLAVVRRLAAPPRPYLKPFARRLGIASQLSGPQKAALLHQLEEFRPDVIFNQDVAYTDAGALEEAKHATGAALVCYAGKPVTIGEIAGYDLVVALLPSVVELAARNGMRAIQSSLAFDVSVLEVVDTRGPRDIEVSFVGTVSEEHLGRIEMLEAVAQRFDLQFFGSGIDCLKGSSPLRKCWRGEVWGRDMYRVLARSKIALNSHLDVVGNEAGNMRLYEATGVRTFLLTDWRAKPRRVFDPERHVATWQTAGECVDRIAHVLSRDEERERIATAGQQHTLSNHTYAQRTRALSEHFAHIL